MKKNVIASAFVFSLGLLMPLAGHAASSTAGATIVTPITISNTVGLQFGQIAASASVGTVSVSTAGSLSSTGGVTLVNGITATAASFDVAGAPNLSYAITLPTSTTINLGSDSMTVDTFVANPSVTGTLSALGTDTLNVGAKLHVGANQPAGAYTGTFDVTVAYN